MSKKISEIYAEYKIMPNLQEHMLRVAAVAYIICDGLYEPLPKEDIVLACLLHDMGNIIKSKFEFFPEFLKPEGLKYWQNIKNEYIKKYGRSEDEATIQIMKELHLPDNIIFLAGQNRFSLVCEHCKINNMNIKIIHYADLRVAPYGVVSYDERMNEAKIRYKTKNNDEEKERQKLITCGKEIEKQIFSKCKIKPEDITDETIKPIILNLKNFVLK
jgi:hypothetical protein